MHGPGKVVHSFYVENVENHGEKHWKRSYCCGKVKKLPS